VGVHDDTRAVGAVWRCVRLNRVAARLQPLGEAEDFAATAGGQNEMKSLISKPCRSGHPIGVGKSRTTRPEHQCSPRSGCQGLTLPGPPLLSRSLVATLPRSLVATLPRPLIATLPRPLIATLPRPLVPAPVAVVVVAVAIAVKVVVAAAALPVEAPAWVPKIPGAPVIQRRRAEAGLGLGTRRQSQTGQP
jgi:hypothetical protein